MKSCGDIRIGTFVLFYVTYLLTALGKSWDSIVFADLEGLVDSM